MAVTELNEPIVVVAGFRGGELRPVCFYWNGSKIRIRKITGRWKLRDGSDTIHFIACVGENDVYYEISFSTKTLVWRLEKLETE